MPKYYEFKVAGYFLYFTSFCVVECMHVHASDRKLTESGSAKFFVKGNGDSVLQNRGLLTDREVSKIQAFIKENYEKMYEKWAQYRVGGADKILDYADRPSFCLYSSGLSPPREILIRFSRYQTI